MKKIKVFKADEVEVKPFVPHIFNQNEVIFSTIEPLKVPLAHSSRRNIRKLAEREGLPFDKGKIDFAKKIIKMMVDEINNGR